MGYFTAAERQHVRDTIGAEFAVLGRSVRGTEFEDHAVDSDDALSMAYEWARKDFVVYAEVFRINSDGTLKPTIGPTLGTMRKLTA